jgi:hypothetical protein
MKLLYIPAVLSLLTWVGLTAQSLASPNQVPFQATDPSPDGTSQGLPLATEPLFGLLPLEDEAQVEPGVEVQAGAAGMEGGTDIASPTVPDFAQAPVVPAYPVGDPRGLSLDNCPACGMG